MTLLHLSLGGREAKHQSFLAIIKNWQINQFQIAQGSIGMLLMIRAYFIGLEIATMEKCIGMAIPNRPEDLKSLTM